MAEQKGAAGKTLEMRVAELEDKLSKVHITEEEMKAYQKVSSLVGQQAQPALSPQVCMLCSTCFHPCIISQCIVSVCIRPVCINECSCGPCGACELAKKDPAGDFGKLGK
jgi:MinD superfamily P-loop ATPase